MNHPERRKARRYDAYCRSKTFTDLVYGGEQAGDGAEKLERFLEGCRPKAAKYQVFFGEMHGHTNFSDGQPDIDTYFHVARDMAELDFCAVTDHDHGGVGKSELWKGKWETIRESVKKYNEPGRFTTILAYEKDSYPWYNNLVIYFDSYEGEIRRTSRDGEMTRKELEENLGRRDQILVPHTTSYLEAGCDFEKMPTELMTSLIEVYSRAGTDEYFGNPNPVRIACRGGFWQDALKRGARMGCICGSDDHQKMPGMFMYEATHSSLPYPYPGITAVLAEENTLAAIFKALKARRCYGMMGGRIYIDFRLNGHYMGEEIICDGQEERNIFFSVYGDKPVKQVTVVKNCENYMCFYGDLREPSCKLEGSFIDYEAVQNTDYYYLRVELTDGRYAWTSPIWVTE